VSRSVGRGHAAFILQTLLCNHATTLVDLAVVAVCADLQRQVSLTSLRQHSRHGSRCVLLSLCIMSVSSPLLRRCRRCRCVRIIIVVVVMLALMMNIVYLRRRRHNRSCNMTLSASVHVAGRSSDDNANGEKY